MLCTSVLYAYAYVSQVPKKDIGGVGNASPKNCASGWIVWLDMSKRVPHGT